MKNCLFANDQIKTFLRFKFSHAEHCKAISSYAVHMARAGSPFSAKGQVHKKSFNEILRMIVRPRLSILGPPKIEFFLILSVTFGKP